MSERSWGEADTAPPPKKKSIPTWLWFCGGGCLLAVIAAIVAGSLIFSHFKDAANPEVQWPKLAEVLPYDQRPPELDLKGGGGAFGVEMYVFDDSRGYAAVLMVFPMSQGADRDELMNPDHGGVMGVGGRKDAKMSKLKIQGREVPVLRFHQMGDKSAGPGSSAPPAGAGPTALVDLTKETGGKFVILQLVSLHSQEEIGDDVIENFLKPFHVGPVR